MRAQALRWTLIWLGSVMAMTSQALGCGDGSDVSSGSGSSSGSDSTSSSSSSASGSSSSSGGAGGAGGGMASDNGHPATETVSAGDVAKSQNYKMVFTFGQPTQNQGKTTSPGYGLRGGLIGATGNAP